MAETTNLRPLSDYARKKLLSLAGPHGKPDLTEWMMARVEQVQEAEYDKMVEMIYERTLSDHLREIDRRCEKMLGDLLDETMPGNVWRMLGMTPELMRSDPAAYMRLSMTAHDRAREIVMREIILEPLP